MQMRSWHHVQHHLRSRLLTRQIMQPMGWNALLLQMTLRCAV